jgi:hypothetical protein
LSGIDFSETPLTNLKEKKEGRSGKCMYPHDKVHTELHVFTHTQHTHTHMEGGGGGGGGRGKGEREGKYHPFHLEMVEVDRIRIQFACTEREEAREAGGRRGEDEEKDGGRKHRKAKG